MALVFRGLRSDAPEIESSQKVLIHVVTCYISKRKQFHLELNNMAL